MRPSTPPAVQRMPEHNSSVTQEPAARLRSRGSVCGKSLRGLGAVVPEKDDSEQQGCCSSPAIGLWEGACSAGRADMEPAHGAAILTELAALLCSHETLMGAGV